MQDYTNNIKDDTLEIDYFSVEEEEVISSKFYNFNGIILYAYMDNVPALELTNKAELNKRLSGIINTPIEMYETVEIAKQMASNTNNKSLVMFAIDVSGIIYDELDLFMSEKINRFCVKHNITEEQFMKEVHVKRNIKQYKDSKSKKVKNYISYTIQNQSAIKAVFPG